MEHQKLIDFLNSLPPSTSSVDLRNKSIGDAGAEALAKDTHLSQLQTLYLWGNRIGVEGAQALANATHLSQLQTLNLSSNWIGVKGVQALANATHLSQLQTLNLGWNQIGDAGAQALANKATHLSQLKTLNLGGNQIGDAGVQALAKATYLSQLQTLDLSNNEIGDAGAQALAKATHLSQLQTLDLSNNRPIGDESAKALLHHLSRLESIDLRYCRLTAPTGILDDLNLLRLHYQIAQVETKVPNTLVRAMFIGEPYAGKTTVFKRLLGQAVTLSDDGEPRTHGLNRDTLVFEAIRNEASESPLTIRLDLWDLGGQRLQHMCHGLFFRSQALYLLVLNQQSTEQGTGHWLELLASQQQRTQSGDKNDPANPAVISVCNPNDKLGKMVDPKKTEWWLDYGEHCDFDNPVTVDVSGRAEGMKSLKNRLRERLEQYSLPHYWKSIDDIAGEVRGLEAPYFQRVEFQRQLIKLPAFKAAHARIQKIQNAKEYEFADLVIAHLDQQGIIANLGETRLVVLQLSWVEKGIYALLPPEDSPKHLSNECRAFQKQMRQPHPQGAIPGVFTERGVEDYWETLGILKEEHHDLLQVLRTPELGLVMSMGRHGNEELLCVPAYLDELRQGDDLPLALETAYRKARYCSVFTAPSWPPYFIYRHMVWIASMETAASSMRTPKQRRGDETEHPRLRLDRKTLAKQHYRITDSHDQAAWVEIIFHDEKLWCFAHFDGDADGFNLRGLIERIESSFNEALFAAGRTQQRLCHEIPCPLCMKILRVPKERFSEAEFFDFLVLARKASDNRMKCKYGHTPRVGYIIEQLKPVDGGATPVEQPAFRTPKLEEIWDAAIVVSVFLHDVGMATLAGKDIHSATPPLCNDEFESSGKTSISKKTWRSWLFENVKLQEGSVKRFVAHLDQRFPIIKEWASQAGASAEFFSETTDPGERLINAAQWVQEYPEQAEQLWRRNKLTATLRENAPVSKRTGSRHAWLSTYLDTRPSDAEH